MSTATDLLAEFESETALTRRLIERIPDSKYDWTPHPKSTSIGALARHLAHMMTWATVALTSSEFDIAERAPMPPTTTIGEVLAAFDANVARTRELLSGLTDEELGQPWTLTGGGRTYLTRPKATVVTHMVVHHMIHHRGQLSVYLRLNDIAVPSVYGPTADEPM